MVSACPSSMPLLTYFKLILQYLLESITFQVEVNRRNARSCLVHFDPIITTFDKRRNNCMHTGDFTLWKSSDGRSAEVQLSIWRNVNRQGNGWSMSPCAVAFREGNHILGLTMCRSASSGNRRVLRRIEYLSDANGRKGVMTRNGDRHTITMPSGTKIEVDNRRPNNPYPFPWINVRVFPLDVDRRTSVGLCGNYNGNPTDDSVSCLVHRLRSNESYFAGPAQCRNYTDPIAYPCDCIREGRHQSVVCGHSSVVERTRYVCTNNLRHRISGSLYSEDDSIVEDDDVFYTMPQEYPPPPNNWPTPSGITMAQARTRCSEVFRTSPVYEQCQTLVNLADLLDTCTLDVKQDDSFDATLDYATLLESECQLAAEERLNITSNDPDVIERERASLVNLTRNICPNHCTERGVCINSTCHCQPGFTNFDCSLDTTLAPEIISLGRNGLCDRRQRPCRRIPVYAVNLDTTSTIYCLVNAIENPSYEMPRMATNATVVTDMEVSCYLPESPVAPPNATTEERTHVTYSLSLSNNGVDFGTTAELAVFDSLCMNCTGPRDCTQKPDSCMEHNVCYAPYQPGRDTCKICVPELSSGLVDNPLIPPPELKSGDHPTFRKNAGSDRVFFIAASDPSGYSFTYRFETPIPGIVISANGIVTWDSTANDNAIGALILTNKCGKSSSWTVHFVVVEEDH